MRRRGGSEIFISSAKFRVYVFRYFDLRWPEQCLPIALVTTGGNHTSVEVIVGFNSHVSERIWG